MSDESDAKDAGTIEIQLPDHAGPGAMHISTVIHDAGRWRKLNVQAAEESGVRVWLDGEPVKTAASLALADPLIGSHADDEHVLLPEAARVAIDPGKAWSPEFITLDGKPIPKVVGVTVRNHMGTRYAGLATSVEIECIAQPVRANAEFTDAVKRWITGTGVNVSRISGYLVTENEFHEFLAWRSARKSA